MAGLKFQTRKMINRRKKISKGNFNDENSKIVIGIDVQWALSPFFRDLNGWRLSNYVPGTSPVISGLDVRDQR